MRENFIKILRSVVLLPMIASDFIGMFFVFCIATVIYFIFFR